MPINSTVANNAQNLCHHPALILNADFQPLSYLPLSLWPWQEAIKAVWLERVQVIAEYEKVARSPRFEMKLPSVLVLKDYVKPQKRVAFTRFNLFLRDEFQCQYCGSSKDLTFEHVVARMYGGRTNWENVIAACTQCNFKKGHLSVKAARLKLKRRPRRPDAMELRKIGRKFPPNYLHESWVDYLYWDSELED